MLNISFLEDIREGAIRTYETYKLLPSITAAQAALESNWGKSRLSRESRNLFGIKSGSRWQGEKKAYMTKEYDEKGKLYTVKDYFRSYPSYDDSLKDHGKFFHDNKRYSKVIGLTDYKKQARAIQAAGYATDPKYASKLIQLVEQYELWKWDEEVVNNNVKKQFSSYVTVNKGDTLGSIAKKMDTTVEALTKINKIKNPHLIYPGQQLIIPKKTQQTKNSFYYVVKKGDTLSKLATRFNVSIQKLAEDNHLANINHIETGKKLFIDRA